MKQEIELRVNPTTGITCYSFSVSSGFPIAITDVGKTTNVIVIKKYILSKLKFVLLRRLKLAMYDVRLSLRNLCGTQVLLLNWHPLQDFTNDGSEDLFSLSKHMLFS